MQPVGDLPALVRQVVRCLRSGGLVVFPTETTPCLAASALVPEAVERLAGKVSPQRLFVAVRGVVEARDWVPGMNSLAQRLARRFWPGPLTLAFRQGQEQGVLPRLHESVRQRLCPNQALHLRSPGHETLLQVLHRLPGPLVLAPLAGSAGAAPLQPLPEGTADLILGKDAGPYPEGATVVEVAGSTFRIEQPGAVTEEMLRRQSACMVVFVCTGNTCRSPLAEALCKQRLSQRLNCAVEDLPKRGYYLLSAGLAATTGGAAAEEAVAVATNYGADLAGHYSRPLTADLAAQADYLIAMTRGHLQALNNHFPRLGSRPRLLSPGGDDIADPIGQDQQVYQVCAQQIWQYLETLVDEIAPAGGATDKVTR